MKKKVGIFAIAVFSVVIGLPIDGSAYSPKPNSVTSGLITQIRVSIGQPRRRRMRRGVYWRNGRYYRNYGQYRRTQVGNRRYRLVPRYYWSDGVRRVRYTRLYY